MTLTHAVDQGLETVAAAQQRLLGAITALAAERVDLDAALGRILAEMVEAAWALPGFDNSAMDGYAVRAADVARATSDTPVQLPVVGESRAGGSSPPLTASTAIRIMTGAPLPAEADAVVKQEDTRRTGDAVLIFTAVPAGTHVRHRGEDVAAGSSVLACGEAITSIDIGVAAALGRGSLLVGRRPLVAVLATGDELVPAGGPRVASQVTDSNSPMLIAAVREAGGTARFLGVAADTPKAVRRLLDAASGSDLIISTAGVSVGDHDCVREVVSELGEIDSWRLAMRPGKPMLIGKVRGAVFLGLPGNPVSSSVTFELFARPAIRKLQGARALHRPRLKVRLGEAMTKPAGLETYARAVLRQTDGHPVATSAGNQASSMLRSLAAADCLLILPADSESLAEGAIVEAIPIR
jgi:molybdopterin molybdotransferase